jgi:hypothetical protein
MSLRDKTRARRPAERRGSRVGYPAPDEAELCLAVTPAPVSYSGSLLVSSFRQGTASAVPKSSTASGVLTLEAAIPGGVSANERRKREGMPHFLIANPRLETYLTPRKQTPVPISNRDFLQLCNPAPRTHLPAATCTLFSASRRLPAQARRPEGASQVPGEGSLGEQSLINLRFSNRHRARLEPHVILCKQREAVQSNRNKTRVGDTRFPTSFDGRTRVLRDPSRVVHPLASSFECPENARHSSRVIRHFARPTLRPFMPRTSAPGRRA